MDDLYRQFAGIALVLAALGAFLWFVKRRGFARMNFRASNKRELVRVVERVPLTAQHTLFVLNVAGRVVLLSSSPGSCQMIAELPPDVLLATQTELAR